MKALPLGRVKGIPVSASWSVVFVAILGAILLARNLLPRIDETLTLRWRILLSVGAIVLFLASILAHEFGHALTARRFGITTSSVRLWIFGGVAALSSPARTPRAEFQIAAAGPAVNAVLAAAFAALSYVNSLLGGPESVTLIGSGLAVLNGLLTVTNLVPAAPLDGGRILSAVLWSRSGRAEWARLISARCGLVLSAAVIAYGIYETLVLDQMTGLYTAAIGIFIGTAARQDVITAAVRQRLERIPVDGVLTPYPPAVPDSMSVRDVERMRSAGGPNLSLPVQRWQHQTIGFVSTAAARTMTEADQAWTPLSDVMIPAAEVPQAWTTETVLSVLERHGVGPSQLLGIDPMTGLVVGTATADHFAPYLIPPTFWGRDRADGLGAKAQKFVSILIARSGAGVVSVPTAVSPTTASPVRSSPVLSSPVLSSPRKRLSR